MPVEIRELNIRTNVSDQPASNAGGGGVSSQQLEALKEEIKKECLEELKQFIKDQTER